MTRTEGPQQVPADAYTTLNRPCRPDAPYRSRRTVYAAWGGMMPRSVIIASTYSGGVTSNDGFLILTPGTLFGSMISLSVLILFILRSKDRPQIENSIKELSNIAEMSLIIGLFLYTIGNFLGGVWANESWGRYWGWDSKETWAAVTILIYATVLHLRFIPKLNTPYSFNVASLWAYSSVLMTYFGVNYYLTGMHSYAAGEPVPIPLWVYYGTAGLFVLSLWAWRKIRNVGVPPASPSNCCSFPKAQGRRNLL